MKNVQTLFKDKFLLSLGFNCTIKRFLDFTKLTSGETNFFDYIGSSMWSINELFQNDFANLFNWTEYKHFQIMNGEKSNYLTNSRYYLRFFHDLSTYSTDKLKDDVVGKYSRRKQRLYDILNESKYVVFIRHEEIIENRIIYDEYAEKFMTNELEHTKNFSHIIKTKFPNLKFKIILLSLEHNDYYFIEHNIILVNISNYYKINWENCIEVYNKIFYDKYDFIYNSLLA